MFDNALNELDRDATGHCKGECKDRVTEGETQRQQAINQEPVDVPEDYPRAEWADDRRLNPGAWVATDKG
ncbi:MAG: hypothetical protein KGY56_01760 [Desulfobacterales bacterium]|nr:hypothetical protein [Desulfobacterales bacterium]